MRLGPMRERHFDCVIVGAGHGGTQAAVALRQAKFEGSIAIFGAEPEFPYDRPSISKDYLSGAKSFERIELKPAAFWESRQIEVFRGSRVETVDASSHLIRTADGNVARYGTLIWSAGGQPRKLVCSGHDLEGVHYIRSKADADALLGRLPTARRVVVIGGGFIGLEAAAVLRKLDIEVTIVEAMERLLARVAGEEISGFFARVHQRHGVEIRLSSQVTALTGSSGKVKGVVLGTGEELQADIVIVGIGILPEVEPLRAAGAECSNGVLIDSYCRTSLADIYCIGDCAFMRDGPGVRIESVQNANDQATTAAQSIAGQAQPHKATPWFWSNQYDLKLQTIGLNVGYDDTVLRGDPDTGAFSLVYLRENRVIAIDCVNAARDYVQGRRLVEARAEVSPALLGDATIPFKSIDIP